MLPQTLLFYRPEKHLEQRIENNLLCSTDLNLNLWVVRLFPTFWNTGKFVFNFKNTISALCFLKVNVDLS